MSARRDAAASLRRVADLAVSDDEYAKTMGLSQRDAETLILHSDLLAS